MAWLIDAEQAEKVLSEYYHLKTETQHRALREALNAVPYTDAEPVVRCYECKHIEYEDGLIWKCGRTNTPTGGIEGFCAWAERKENEHDPAD
jgi:hypothetical protein